MAACIRHTWGLTIFTAVNRPNECELPWVSAHPSNKLQAGITTVCSVNGATCSRKTPHGKLTTYSDSVGEASVPRPPRRMHSRRCFSASVSAEEMASVC